MKSQPSPLSLPAGVVKTESDLAAQGRYKDADKVRFVNGKAEKIGGWTKYQATPTPGVVRANLCWDASSGERWMVAGSTTKVYAYQGAAAPVNITPLEDSGTLGANPFTTVSGSPNVTVHDVAHARLVGDHVIFAGASTFNSVNMNGEWTVASITGADDYVVTYSGNASASSSGGGAAVTFSYELTPGLIDDSTVASTGWGAGGWGAGLWGGGSGTGGIGEARFWSLDLYGTMLLAAPSGGTLYSWTPGAGILASVLNAPGSMRYMFVTEQRFIIALGTSDSLTMQWPDQNDMTAWTVLDTNTANIRRVQVGTRLVAGAALQGLANIIWTDEACYLHTYTGSKFVFDTTLQGRNCGLVGPKAFAIANGAAYWLGANGFFMFTGYVQNIPKQEEIWTWFNQINVSQSQKTVCHYDPTFSEIRWIFPAAAASEPDTYVAVNLQDFSWVNGTISRTSAGQFKVKDARPVMFNYAGQPYLHEATTDDDGAAMLAYLESAAVEIGDGDSYWDVDGFIPNFASDRWAGAMSVEIRTWDRATQGDQLDDETESFTPTDQIVDFRCNGRAVSFKVVSNVIGGDFRFGTPKIMAKTRGDRR